MNSLLRFRQARLISCGVGLLSIAGKATNTFECSLNAIKELIEYLLLLSDFVFHLKLETSKSCSSPCTGCDSVTNLEGGKAECWCLVLCKQVQNRCEAALKMQDYRRDRSRLLASSPPASHKFDKGTSRGVKRWKACTLLDACHSCSI